MQDCANELLRTSEPRPFLHASHLQKMCRRSALPYLRASLGRSEALCIMTNARSRDREPRLLVTGCAKLPPTMSTDLPICEVRWRR